MTQLFMTHPGPLPGKGPAVPGIRAATDSDGPALARLLTETFDGSWSVDRVLADLLHAPDVPVTWVLPAGTDYLAATASERLLPETYPGAGYVHYVGVAAAGRGRGLGTAMTLATLAGFAARGLESAVLETDDFRQSAVVVYLRLGFVPTYRSDAETAAWSRVFPTLLGSSRVPA